MLNQEEIDHMVDLMGDLEVDLRNGNVPTSELLITSIVNGLVLKHELDFRSFGNFLIGNLEDVETRKALLHFIPKLKEWFCPTQPPQEVTKEC